MATLKSPPFAAIAAALALLAVPAMSLSGGVQSTMLIAVNVRTSASFRIQNGADLVSTGYTAMTDATPVLVLNTPPVKPEVIIEVSADAAGPATSQGTGELSAEAGGQQGAEGGKLLSLRDLGVAPPAPSPRFEGTNLKDTFERAAGEIIYRLDQLKGLKPGRQAPVLVNINL